VAEHEDGYQSFYNLAYEGQHWQKSQIRELHPDAVGLKRIKALVHQSMVCDWSKGHIFHIGTGRNSTEMIVSCNLT